MRYRSLLRSEEGYLTDFGRILAAALTALMVVIALRPWAMGFGLGLATPWDVWAFRLMSYWVVWAITYLGLTWILIIRSPAQQTRRWAWASEFGLARIFPYCAPLRLPVLSIRRFARRACLSRRAESEAARFCLLCFYGRHELRRLRRRCNRRCYAPGGPRTSDSLVFLQHLDPGHGGYGGYRLTSLPSRLDSRLRQQAAPRSSRTLPSDSVALPP
jgi:hypothetical protein